MSLIPCDDDCIYQVDGYCKLESPAAITNHLGGCVHYIKAISPKSEAVLHNTEVSSSEPQMLP